MSRAGAADTPFTVTWDTADALGSNVYQTFVTGTLFPDYITNAPTVTAGAGTTFSAPFTLPGLLSKSVAAPKLGVQVCTPVAGGTVESGTCKRVATATALTQCNAGRKLKL